LGQMSCSDDITVAVRRHNRSPECALRIAPLACLVPVRISLANHPSFRTVVGRVNDACAQAASLFDAALEPLFERITRQYGSSQRAFQAGFAYAEKVAERVQSADMTWSSLQIRKSWLEHELLLRVTEKPEMFCCVVAYDRDL